MIETFNDHFSSLNVNNKDAHFLNVRKADVCQMDYHIRNGLLMPFLK